MIGINDVKFNSVSKKDEWIRSHLRCRAGVKDAVLLLCEYGMQEHIFKSKKETKLHLACRAMFDFFPYDYRHVNRFKTSKTKTIKAYETLANKVNELQRLHRFNDLNADITVWLTPEASGRLNFLADRMGIPETFVMRMCLLNCLSSIDELGSIIQQFCTIRFEKHKQRLDEHLKLLKQTQSEISIIDTDAAKEFEMILNKGEISTKNVNTLSLENRMFLQIYIDQIECIGDTFRWKK